MSDLHIDVEAIGGAHGKNVCREVAALATRMQINVFCKFNDVRILARPGEDGDLIWRSLAFQISQDAPFRFATMEDGVLHPMPENWPTPLRSLASDLVTQGQKKP